MHDSQIATRNYFLVSSEYSGFSSQVNNQITIASIKYKSYFKIKIGGETDEEISFSMENQVRKLCIGPLLLPVNTNNLFGTEPATGSSKLVVN